MRKILVLVYLVLQSCGSYSVVNYDTPSIQLRNQVYERYNNYYRNSWENTYYRPNYLYYNDLWLRNRYFNYNAPIYRIPIRPKVKPKTRPRPRPRIRPNNPPRRVNPPSSTPRRVSSSGRRGNNNNTNNRKQ